MSDIQFHDEPLDQQKSDLLQSSDILKNLDIIENADFIANLNPPVKNEKFYLAEKSDI